MKTILILLSLFITRFSYGDTLDLLKQIPPEHQETAVLAGGCFWGMEDIIRKIPGVVSTDVGYSNEAEAVKVNFDKRKLTYRELLSFYFRMHNPTTLNRQGNDIGPQYRSAIFYTNAEQKKEAEEMIKATNNSKKWEDPVVTKIEPFTKFKLAEEFHQNYLVKNPQGYTCHFLRN